MEIEEKDTARGHDVDMEDVGALESSFTYKLSQFLFEKLAEARPEVENVGMKMLKTDEDDVDDMNKLVQDLAAFIVGEYSLGGVGDISTVVAVAQSASEYAEELLASPETALLDAELLRQLQIAFSERYEGDAHVKFQAFLVRCWKAYKINPGKYLSPLAALVQSSGFGKSRMLREVARITADDSSIQPTEADPVSMRVLYICTRDEKKSSGFPLATPELTKLFFGNRPKVDSITSRLLNTWQYAQEHWSDVGKDWLKLFSEQDADKAVADAIQAMSKRGPAQLNKDGGDRNRLLVLVVDEARSLFDGSEVDGTTSYVHFQKALTMANDTLFKQNSNCGGIFSVLVDTSSKVHDFVPLKENDASSRAIKHKEAMAPFPPFVMTHNMDVFLRGREAQATNSQAEEKLPALDRETAAFDYRASVTCDDPGAHWNALVSMGRPLWKTFIDEHATLAFQQKAISDLAASKLLMGQPVSLDKSYNASTMQGTAALFCRLGLRPHSSAPIATRTVADFMAVLSYVSFTNDSHITGYPSEPALAFGAARLWYQLQSKSLEKHILPRFQGMLMQGMVDTGDTGEVAARIFLLLAMDATTMLLHNQESKTQEDFIFTGQFCSVRVFLDMLSNSTDTLRMHWLDEVMPEQRTQHTKWLEKWKTWQVGFVQFEDLAGEPTEETLWQMLGRRSAGLHRRGQRGSDLVIPIFSGHDVSCILVQVKNFTDDDAVQTLATCVFENDCYLSKIEPHNMVRVEITLDKVSEHAQVYFDMTPPDTGNRGEEPEEATKDQPQARIRSLSNTKSLDDAVAEPARKKAKTSTALFPKDAGYMLSLQGVCLPSQGNAASGSTPWPFLSANVAKYLGTIANSAWWDVKERVKNDLARRSHSIFADHLSVLTDADLLEMSEFSMP